MCCRDSQRPVLVLLGHREQLLTTGFPLVMTKSGECKFEGKFLVDLQTGFIFSFIAGV